MNDLRTRFEAKVGRLNGCWLWLAHTRQGYGFIWVNGAMRRAHRVAWELYVGPIPEGLHVCHRCDVPACVNPQHLFLGDQAENLADMRRKQRGASGERHGHAKLTALEVEQIRALLRDGLMGKDLAVRFGVSQATVSHIRRGKNWFS